MSAIFGETKYFENWHGYSAEIPSRSKILLSSLHLARFSRYKHFCVLQKLGKFKTATILGRHCRGVYLPPSIKGEEIAMHNFSFSCVKALPKVGEGVIREKLAICNTIKR